MNRTVCQTALPVPVTIVAGFLGAGKTTLMNHILTADHGRRIAVIVNDFGAVNVDAELVTAVGDGKVSLASGCICCAIRSDLIGAVLKLTALHKRPEQILIESSGVADPNSVFRTFLQPEIRTEVLIDGVLTVVDAEQYLALAEARLAREQVTGGDLVILNKTDLVDEAALDRAEAWITAANPRAPILRAVACRLPVDVLLGARLSPPMGSPSPETEKDAAPGADHDHRHDHGSAFESWTYRSDRPLRLSRLKQVLDRMPAALFRAKGFIFAGEEPDRRLLLQFVGRRAVLSADRPWGETARETHLVFIARRGACNVSAINDALGRCSSDPVVHG